MQSRTLRREGLGGKHAHNLEARFGKSNSPPYLQYVIQKLSITLCKTNPIRISLWLLLFLSWSCVCEGQYFSKHYSLYAGTNGYISSIQVVDDTIYAMCYVGDSLNPAISIAAFEKFDRYGNLIMWNPLNIPVLNNIFASSNTLIRTNDGGYAYGAFIGIDSVQNAIIILKYDGYGNFQWYKEIIENSLEFQCTRLVQDSFSNYYLTGIIQHTVGIDADMFLTKTDSVGNVIYTKQYFHPSFNDAAWSILFDASGHIILGGSCTIYNVVDLTTYKGYMEIYELDTAGNQLNYFLGADSSGPFGINILPTNDGGYLIANVYVCYKGPTEDKSQGSIAKLDSNFHQVWKIDIGPCSQHTFFYAQSASPDGNYIAVGQWYDDGDTTASHKNGWIVKYSGDGQVIWSKLYRGITSNGPNGDDNILGSMGFMSDGSIICAGQAESGDLPGHPQQQGWLLHLDTAGCLPDSNSCGIPNGITELNKPLLNITLYPNPSSGEVFIDIQKDDLKESSYILTNTIGQTIYQSTPTYSHSQIINLSKLPSGLYLLDLTADGQHIIKKLVKE